jgi:hypothetical protein
VTNTAAATPTVAETITSAANNNELIPFAHQVANTPVATTLPLATSTPDADATPGAANTPVVTTTPGAANTPVVTPLLVFLYHLQLN